MIMSNEQLTWAFSILAGLFLGTQYIQWRFNFGVAARLHAAKAAIELIVEKFEAAGVKNKVLLEAVKGQLESLLARVPRPRNPPGT